MYHIFAGAIYHIVFSPICQLLGFCLWRWDMTFLETEVKELGRSTYSNTHNTRSLIGTLSYVPDIVADGILRWKIINTETRKDLSFICHWRQNQVFFMCFRKSVPWQLYKFYYKSLLGKHFRSQKEQFLCKTILPKFIESLRMSKSCP